MQPLETQHLVIRPFQSTDCAAVHTYMADPTVTAYLPEGTFTAAQAAEFVARNSGVDAEVLAVILRAEDTLIGHMIFHPWFAHRTYEIGWVFSRRYHGRGYATEAADALLRHGFATLDLHRIIATCQPENIPSYRVMEKLGMRREAHFRQCIYRGEGHWWDETFYAILADEWRARP